MIKNTMEQNANTMNNIRTGRNIIFVVDMLLCLFNVIFYVVGGFMFFFLFNLFAIAASFFIGSATFRNRKLQICLSVINLAAAILYLLIKPVSGLMYISCTAQHVFCIIQLLCFMNMGKIQEGLMGEEGYPYFTEQAAISSEYKDYVPDNHRRPVAGEMETLNTLDHIVEMNNDKKTDNTDIVFNSMKGINTINDRYNHQPVRSDRTTEYSMGEISNSGNMDVKKISEQKSDYQMPGIDYNSIACSEKEESEEKINKKEYSERFNVFRKPVNNPENLCDPDVMRSNKSKMNSLQRKKKIIFTADILMIFGTIFMFAFNISKIIFVSPFYLLVLVNLVVVASASIVSQTSLDDINLCRKVMIVYFMIGLILSVLCFKYTVPIACFLCAIQMIILENLASQNNYLKSQEGYPYFNEAALRHLRYTEEYTPTRDIDFSPKKMDEI